VYETVFMAQYQKTGMTSVSENTVWRCLGRTCSTPSY